MTVRELINSALSVIGLYGGDNPPCDTADLDGRAIMLINVLLGELATLDCRIKREPPKIYSVSGFSDNLQTCDIISSSVLPFGLAALFALGEDDNLYLTLQSRYNAAKANALALGRAKAEPIREVY
ncbi:MAG: hypothetical protein J6R45_04090 [Clostridia bacterium]|nr:hypothetical protein [Clostridia bacterium]MBO5914169.1 hypothetical protein [Clostridia bacterium]